jgi:hypothetical protein
MLFASAGNLVLSTLRTLFFLFAKRAGCGAGRVRGFLGGGRPSPAAARPPGAAGRGDGEPPGARLPARMVPPGHSFRKLAEFAVGALSKSRPADMVGSHHAQPRSHR